MFPIRFVLVGSSHPGNIGGSARAMKNMGLESLWLVAPLAFPHPDAMARASGAGDVLARARVCETLDEAIADCGLVVAATARQRSLGWPTLSPRDCAARVAGAIRSTDAAIVFGREKTGLSNEEIDRCGAIVTIPANLDYSSLNLAMAVQIVAYEIRLALEQDATAVVADDRDVAASAQDLKLLFEHLERVLVKADFLDPAHPRRLMRRLVRLFQRAGLDRNELNILRGILTAVEAPLDARAGSSDRP
ncbi:tRNA (cytosine(32)/uridine(32)-2'-O)-methyltransferase TrmJ [soil metagenome]